jgi:hypothetical protein
MKGMMDLLEKAGLVRRVGDADAPLAESAELPAPEPLPETAAPLADTTGMTLEQVYAAAGVPACAYPAERLLRLLDGLKAMDAVTRRQTIQAIDAADDSWTLDDPKRDAQAKVAAIEAHSASIRSGVAQAEQEAHAQLRAQTQAQEVSVAEIRRQISELEGLLAREIARGAQENAALEASLQATRESANRELTQLARSAGALTGLIAQLGSNPSH